MKAEEVVFKDLLNQNTQYVVPLYQRTYSWDEKQWEQLWDDIIDIYTLSSPRNHLSRVNVCVNEIRRRPSPALIL